MNAKIFTDGLATKKHPEFSPGDTIAIYIKIKEGEKERIQLFEGIVVKMKRGGNSASFTVRKISFGVGVERIFPMQCANIDRIEVVKRGKVRRAKLFYIRELQGKALRIQDQQTQEGTDDSESVSIKTPSVKSSKKETQEAASAN